MSQSQVQYLTAFNKLVDVENKKENQSDFNFTAWHVASNDPAWPRRSRLPRSHHSERGSISVPGWGCSFAFWVPLPPMVPCGSFIVRGIKGADHASNSARSEKTAQSHKDVFAKVTQQAGGSEHRGGHSV